MRHPLVFRRSLAVTVAGLVASLALGLGATGASAATSSVSGSQVASQTTGSQPGGVTGNPNQSVTATVTETVTVDPNNSAGDPCTTDTFTYNLYAAPFNWPLLAWFKMATYFCYNGVIVTYHNTRVTGAATGPGAATGWTYDGVVNGSEGWFCYVAHGSSRNCSGNEEYAEGNFQDCLIKFGCIGSWYPYIWEWQNYKGGNGGGT